MKRNMDNLKQILEKNNTQSNVSNFLNGINFQKSFVNVFFHNFHYLCQTVGLRFVVRVN